MDEPVVQPANKLTAEIERFLHAGRPDGGVALAWPPTAGCGQTLRATRRRGT